VSAPPTQELFDEVAERLLAGDPSVERGRMMSAVGLKTSGRFFAMVVGGELVVKLPAERVGELVAAGAGHRWDRGDGRPLREWLALKSPDAAACGAYVAEAQRFVAALEGPVKAGRRAAR
jgi:hypothetical protein